MQVARVPLLMVALLLAGCLDVGEPRPMATLEPPVWAVGDHWDYQDGEGQWLNLSVEATEHRAGYDTYRLRASHVQNDFRPFDLWMWLDKETLGTVEWGRPDSGESEGARNSPPTRQVFPLENRSYTSLPNDDFREPENLTLRVLGWHTLETPAGWFRALEFQTTNEEGWRVEHAWYSPEVGYVVRQGDYRLEAWHYG